MSRASSVTSEAVPEVVEAVWRPMVRQLVERLIADGHLLDDHWREALLSVPRHYFVPRGDAPSVDEATSGWLQEVYSPATLDTESLVRVLEGLDLRDGMRVLEIGTDTGYAAALLCHRLGEANVVSVDAAHRVELARPRLARCGRTPTLVDADGTDGWVDRAPYDRILATRGFARVPTSWIRQLLPDGVALVHLVGALGEGNLVALRRHPNQAALAGRFLPWPGCCARGDADLGEASFADTSGAAAARTAFDPTALDDGRGFLFFAQLCLPQGARRAVTTSEATPVTELRTRDGSWCRIERMPDGAGEYRALEFGGLPLLSRLEDSWAQWRALGSPAHHQFGLTATSTEQHVWLGDPDTGPRWSLPDAPGPASER